MFLVGGASRPSPFLRNYPEAFGKKLVDIYQALITNKRGMPDLPSRVPPGIETFTQMTFEDPWQDADVVSAIHWLRGGRSLAIPKEWRDALPQKL